MIGSRPVMSCRYAAIIILFSCTFKLSVLRRASTPAKEALRRIWEADEFFSATAIIDDHVCCMLYLRCYCLLSLFALLRLQSTFLGSISAANIRVPFYCILDFRSRTTDFVLPQNLTRDNVADFDLSCQEFMIKWKVHSVSLDIHKRIAVTLIELVES